MRLANDLSLSSRAALGGSGGMPGWVPNPANPPDIAVNWVGNQAWLKSTGLTTPALLGIATSRATVKQVVDSNGNWSQVAANVTARSDLGRSTEEARTNSIRNNTMQGAVVCADNVEHLTNGNFAGGSGITAPGWTVNVGSGAINFTGSSFQITGDGTTNNTYIAQQISGLVVGRNYVIVVAGSGTVQASVGNSPGNGSVLGFSSLTGNGNGSNNTDRAAFTATATTHWISFSKLGAVLTTMTSFSVQDGERVQNGGFTTNPINAAQSTFQNGWEWTNNAGTGTVVWNGSSNVTLTGDGTHAASISVAIPTLIGATYTITVDITGNTVSVQAANAAFGSSLLNVTSGTTTGQKFQFTATATTTFITFFHLQATASVVANVSVQSAGALPTNWFINGNATGSGLSASVVGTGTQNGIDYIDYRISGTVVTNNNPFANLFFDTTTAISAVYGQTWTASVFFAVQAGSLSNIAGCALQLNPRIAGGLNGVESSVQGFSSSTFQRYSTNLTLSASTEIFVDSSLALNFALIGTAVDVTFRIGWPQLENNGINSTVASATIAAGGASGVTGTAVYSVGGGTGTAATLNVTVSGGAITAINSVASAGSYTVFPTSPAALTYVSGTGSGVVGATVNLTPTNLAANALATSPIKTTGSALARASDITTLAGQTFGSAYSMFSQVTPQAPTSYGTNQGLLAFTDGTANNRFCIFRQAGGGSGSFSDIIATINQAVPANTGILAQNISTKLALAAAAGAQAVSKDGAAVTTSASASIAAPNSVVFGNPGTGGGLFNGLAAIDAIWLTQAVPSAQLVSMTT